MKLKGVMCPECGTQTWKEEYAARERCPVCKWRPSLIAPGVGLCDECHQYVEEGEAGLHLPGCSLAGGAK